MREYLRDLGKNLLALGALVGSIYLFLGLVVFVFDSGILIQFSASMFIIAVLLVITYIDYIGDTK